jgi:hypothetical protein
MRILLILPGTGWGTSRRLVEGARGKRQDRSGSDFRVSQNLSSRDSHEAIPVLVQKSVTRLILRDSIRLRMAFAVDLDHKPCRRAVEVYDIRSDRMLSAKSDTPRFSPEPLPQQHFG